MNKSSLTRDFMNLIVNYPTASELLRKLSLDNELLLFGGCIRSYLDNGFNILPRDFDIVLKKIRPNNIEELLAEYSYVKNRFGGYKIKIDTLEFDVWELENTWAFKNTDIIPDEANLSSTVFLNIDGIVYNLSTSRYYDDIYISARTNKCIDIVLENNPYMELNFLRSLVYKRQYNMRLSDRLKNWMREFGRMNSNYVDILYECQLKHYNGEKIGRNDIIMEFGKILYNYS